MGIDIDAAEIVRRLVAWGQGRMDERLLWMFARKCGDCMDWAIDIAGKHDTNVTLWEGYYKGPTYTEFLPSSSFRTLTSALPVSSPAD